MNIYNTIYFCSTYNIIRLDFIYWSNTNILQIFQTFPLHFFPLIRNLINFCEMKYIPILPAESILWVQTCIPYSVLFLLVHTMDIWQQLWSVFTKTKNKTKKASKWIFLKKNMGRILHISTNCHKAHVLHMVVFFNIHSTKDTVVISLLHVQG